MLARTVSSRSFLALRKAAATPVVLRGYETATIASDDLAELNKIKHKLLSSRLARRLDMEEAQPLQRHVHLLGAPISFGQPIMGVERGPIALRQTGLYHNLCKINLRVSEHGDLEFKGPSQDDPKLPRTQGRARNCFAVGNAVHAVAKRVDEVHTSHTDEAPTVTVVLGGDQTASTGTIAGVLKSAPDTGVVWVSAHAGLNTPRTTPSGNMHGMSLTLVTDPSVNHNTLPGFSWLSNDGEFSTRLRPDRVVLVGIREVDEMEIEAIRSLGITAYTMHDIDHHGIGRVMDMAIDHLQKGGDKPLHLSYDVNAMDPDVAPATFTKVKGGLSFREAHFVAESLALTKHLRSVDIVEVNPTVGTSEGISQSMEVASEVVLSALGKNILNA